MTPDALQSLKEWFSAFCSSFSTPVVEDQRNITVKQTHTHEVCLNALRIAQDLALDREQTMLAEAMALLHDVGRFPQYQQYKTFDDAISVNHAVLGARTLHETNALQGLPKREQDLVLRSVTLHNALVLPPGLDDETLLFVRLIRDADKLDVMRVIIEFFEQDEGDRAGAVVIGLPYAPGYSREVLSCVERGEMARKEMLRTQNDFKLMQLSWIYDLNYASSFQMVVERDSILKLFNLLPRTDEIARAVDVVRGYVSKSLRDR